MKLEAIMKEHAALVARFLDFHFDTEAIEERLSANLALQSDSAPSTGSQKLSEKLPEKLPNGLDELSASVRYSTLQEGSKRFRPVLAMLVAEALGNRSERVLAYAAAVECVHTYSLIHDDLPAMDNDDSRRGQPTNHKKFGEATAILAGDALLTEAFYIIAHNYVAEPGLAIQAVFELSKASGLYGMVGGQAIDMNAKKESVQLTELKKMHRLKTGALIKASAVGSAVLCGASESQLADIESYAGSLGLAFQVADDLLDFDPVNPEPGSYPSLLGPEKTKEYLNELTESCLASLKNWPEQADPLREIARYNKTRTT